MSSLQIRHFLDSRAGHQRQSAGLCAALARHYDCHLQELHCTRHSISDWLSGRFAAPAADAGAGTPLLIGAGHATHLPMLAARRATGGRILVLMKPSLPLSWFDCCIIPEHDGPAMRDNIILSRGALNPLRATDSLRDPGCGLILIGGPSRHYLWEENGLRERLLTILRREPDSAWQLADSPRTPASTCTLLQNLSTQTHCSYVHHADTTPDWLPDTLCRAAQVWVSEDSVSMLYEALSCGAGVGLLPVPVLRKHRLQQQTQRLIREGLLTSFHQWLQRPGPLPSTTPLQEAERCVRLLQERGFLPSVTP